MEKKERKDKETTESSASDEITDISTPTPDEKCLLHVMGPHAGEGTAPIFTRKSSDIEKVGSTMWVTQIGVSYESSSYYPNGLDPIKAILGEKPWVYFISPSVKNGAKDTDVGTEAKMYKSLQVEAEWKPVPKKMSPVTGKLGKDGTTKALVFDKLEWNLDSSSKVDLSKMA